MKEILEKYLKLSQDKEESYFYSSNSVAQNFYSSLNEIIKYALKLPEDKVVEFITLYRYTFCHLTINWDLEIRNIYCEVIDNLLKELL